MRGRVGIAFFVAAAVTVAAVPVASAKTKVMSGDLVPVGAGQQVLQKLKCPAGLRVSGGGVYTSGSSLEDEVSDSFPFDGGDGDAKPDDGWKGGINGGAAGSEMQTWAICTDAIKLSYSSAPAQPVSYGGDASVPCPAGEIGLGGGIEVPGKVVTSPLKGSIVSAVPDGWQSKVINLTSPTPTGHAICTTSGRVVRTSGSLNIGPSQQDSFEAQCPARSRLLSGGGTGDSDDQLELASLLPSDGDDGDAKPDDAWTMWFNNESGSQTDSMNSHALCLK